MRAQPQVPSLCIDETSLSCGELYTVVTNRAGRGGQRYTCDHDTWHEV